MHVRLASLIAVSVLTIASCAHERALPRYGSLSIGAGVNPSIGHATAEPPDLLLVAPELQLSWGLQVADQLLVLTRFDMLGVILPFGPSGIGADLAFAWTPDLAAGGWRPLLRFGGGAFAFSSGGEGLGPDYTAVGFRMALEAGLFAWPGERGPNVQMQSSWGVIAGVQLIGLDVHEPCEAGDTCSDALIGPTLRVEWGLHF